MRQRSVSSKDMDTIMKTVQETCPGVKQAEVVYFDKEYGLQEFLAEKEQSK